MVWSSEQARLLMVVRPGRLGQFDQAAQTMLAKRLGKAVSEAVVDNSALLASCDEAGGPQNPQGVADAVLAGVEGEGEIADAELLDVVERVKHTGPGRIGDQGEHSGEPAGVLSSWQAGAGAIHPIRVDRVRMWARTGH